MLFAYHVSRAQKKGHSMPDLYLYFKVDSAQGALKITKQSSKIGPQDKGNVPAQYYDVYYYQYIAADGRKQFTYQLFSTLEKNNYCISDSSIFKKHKVLPYKELEKIKGLISDEWTEKSFGYKKVYLVEKLHENQFKVSQVRLYFMFNSNGVRIKYLAPKENEKTN